MCAFGESRREGKIKGETKDKIYSFNTFKTYEQNIKYFIRYVNANHPEVHQLAKARKYVPEYLKSCEEKNESAWTIHTKAKSLSKLYGINKEDADYYTPPKRFRRDIVRSRFDYKREKRFSSKSNEEFINFCRSTGLRRSGITKLKGKDLWTRDEIQATLKDLKFKKNQRVLTKSENTLFRICADALLFTHQEYFIYTKEKGGRERISPIIGHAVDATVNKIKNTPPNKRVWNKVSTSADIHSYRSDYATALYKEYARNLEDIPYDKYHSGTGHRFQSEVYHCRGDMKGRKLDKSACLIVSKALGHDRIDIFASNYLRGF